MDEHRLTMAVEAAAKALHDSVRREHQLSWDLMTETWREDMREYVRPCVLATLQIADTVGRPSRKTSGARRAAARTQPR